MIDICCPLCGENSLRPLMTGRDFIRGTGGTFRAVLCPECGLVYLNPRPEPDELAEYYSDAYRQWQSVPPSGLAARVRGMGARRKVAKVSRYESTGRVLDIGCGGGDFLLEAGRAGWSTAGTEFDERQACRAASYSGADVRVGDAGLSGFEEQSFDVVTLWHVLEHSPDPLKLLGDARRALKPGGLIVVALPDTGSWGARIFKEYWAGYDVPRHLVDFSRETLSRALASAGFRVESMSYFMGTYDNVLISVQFLIGYRVKSPAMRKLLLALAGNPATRLLLTPAALLAQRAGRGTVVTAFARKED